MREDGEGLGPPLCLRSHGVDTRGVLPSPTLLDGIDADLPFPHPVDHPAVRDEEGVDETGPSAEPSVREIHIEPLPQFFHARTFPVGEAGEPLRQKTRRVGNIITVHPGPDVGTGMAYRHHAPLTTHIRVNDAKGTPLSSLLDTGASLSVIDRHLLEKLGGTVMGQPTPVSGLGSAMTLGWSTITFFVDARDERGNAVSAECTLDFHVLEAFAPGLCLGQDFISTHGITIQARRGTAALEVDNRLLTFAVHDHLPAPYAKQAELCVLRDVVVPARSHAWVPVDTACLAPGLDYTCHPRFTVDAAESIRIAGPLAVIDSGTSHLLLTNLGKSDALLDRRTPVADALVAQVGDVAVEASHSFTMTPTARTGHVYSSHSSAAPIPDVDVEPLEMYEHEEGPDIVSPNVEAATTMVDGVFKVGIGAEGEPPPPLVDLLRRHSAAFALDGRPGRVEGHEMPIDLVDDRALHPEAPRRASPEKQRAMDSTIDQLLEWDVIEPSTSPISFPVLMVRQYEKWRFCVDYRQLNANTVSDSYPLPTTDAIFNSLAGKRVYSSLDAIRGYHQLPVRESDRWKTAFTCHRGLYQYKTIPFGLRNAPAVFQRLMDSLLGELRWKDAVVYIDDVVVATRDMGEHLRALDLLLTRATRAGLKFSPAKCTFGVPSLVLLGRKVSGAGVAVWNDRARAVLDLRRPVTLRQLYHAMGLFGYYRSFIPGFASIAAPLTALTRGWRYDRCGDRSRLVSADGSPANADRVNIPWGDPQQAAFDQLKRAIASPPVLAHPDPCRPYVLYVDASKDGFGAVLHQVFEGDDVEVAPAPAVAKLHALDVPLLPPAIARERWLAWLRRDRYFSPILRTAELGGDTEWVVKDGLLIRRLDGVIALPESGLPDLLRTVHDRRGHFGFTKSYLALRRHFWRPGLSSAVRSWVKHCRPCMETKLGRRTGRLDVEDDMSVPFEGVAMDLLLGFPRSRAGNDAVFVVLDLFSRMVVLEPCSSSITAEGIAAILSNRVLRYGWRPRRLVPDSEARLTGEVMSALATSLRAELTPSVPHHHQANPAERCIQTVKHVLQALCVESRAHWDRRALPAAELAINATPSVVTGFCPFDLVFVSHPDVVHCVFDDQEHAGVSAFGERLAAADARLEDARIALHEARKVQKVQYDGSRAPIPSYEVGDQAFVRLPDRPVPGTMGSKLAPRKLGPFRVRAVLGDHRVALDLPDHLNIGDTFSVSQLDAIPRDADPFETHRAEPSPVADRVSPPASVPSSPELPPRRRRTPLVLRGYESNPRAFSLSPVEYDALRGPYHRPRRVELEGRSVVLVERPIAFLSRLTTVSERKMVAPELELCCLAWAFGRFLHLLEGADVTVVTDHSPLGAMLTSSAGAKYGPVISRCRALLLPHLVHLRFVHRPGSSHTNADALSRLVDRSETNDSLGGGM
ncbi:hypothetical protein A4X13_0g7845 [Tilletia indica]|uniref:RNA-directed DNA polymerase n=1 Tax=Tilletia indica TaxID=43049 RepID=A0A177T5N0_9BASI|nr:hypothetical protein A4X13_0g7845 [Tilletia indica]